MCDTAAAAARKSAGGLNPFKPNRRQLEMRRWLEPPAALEMPAKTNRFKQQLTTLGREFLTAPTIFKENHMPIHQWTPASSPSFMAFIGDRRLPLTPIRRPSVLKAAALGPQVKILSSATNRPLRSSSFVLPQQDPSTRDRSRCLRRRGTEPRRSSMSALELSQRTRSLGAMPRRARRAGSLDSMPAERLTVSAKKAREEELRAVRETITAAKMVDQWERVFKGVERQVLYLDSLSTATKLPEIGRWQQVGCGIVGNIADLRKKFGKTLATESVVL